MMRFFSTIKIASAILFAFLWINVTAVRAESCPAERQCATAKPCKKADLPNLHGYWVLAVSWQPGFCETRNQPGCPVECRNAPSSPSLTLHGLWPQWSEYCGVSAADLRCACARNRSHLPAVSLSPAVETSLSAVMPGHQSLLERHQWIKHGTCSGLSPDDYFALAVRLTETLNQSGLHTLLAENAGSHIRYAQLCATLRAAFGPKAASAVEIQQISGTGPHGNVNFLTGLLFWLQPIDGMLGLHPENFVAIDPDWLTLSGSKPQPLCSLPPQKTVFIDKPGLGR